MVHKKDETCNIEYVPSTFQVHKFTTEVSDRTVLYQVIKMQDSLLMFINFKDEMRLTDLSLALQSRYDSLPLHTQLIGKVVDDTSTTLATKLSKKLNKTVYISCNIQQDRLITPAVEKSLLDEVKRNPGAF